MNHDLNLPHTSRVAQRFPQTAVALGLGSNMGDRLANLRLAADALGSLLVRPSFSRIYETEPLHVLDQPMFLNACCTGLTNLGPSELLARMRQIECEGGREREGPRFGPRTIDLDLLLYGEEVLDTPSLTIPHPRLHERPFVLVPLAELAPNWQHVALGQSIGRLAVGVDAGGIRLTDMRLRGSRSADGERGGGS
ncbi:MAG: 2-amino-4-hydroxy-6-hydroxymethyldihydropteridine diphosphokinase [Gemmatimonadota bacterium]